MTSHSKVARPKSLDQRIGYLVNYLRTAHRIKQTEIAGVMGLDQSALSRVETGKQQLTVWQWVLFCEHVGIRPNVLDLVKGEKQ